MKKIAKSVISAGLAVAFAVVPLAACGDDGSGKGNIAFRSEKIVDETAWKAAFDYDDVNNATLTWVGKNGSENHTQIIARDGYKFYLSESENDGKEEQYVEVRASDSRNNIYSYDEQDKEWNVEASPWEHGDADDNIWPWFSLSHAVNEIDDMTYIFDSYSDYSYDEEIGAYVAEGVRPSLWTECKVTVKFKGGKFVHGTATGTLIEGGEMTYEVSITDVGTTKVTLPDV